MAINAQELQGQWNQLKGQVKQKWGQLTDDDLNVAGGNLDQVIGKIQQRTGEGREVIEKFFGTLTSSGASAVSQAAEKVRDFASNSGERFATDMARQASSLASGTSMLRTSSAIARPSRLPQLSGSAW